MINITLDSYNIDAAIKALIVTMMEDNPRITIQHIASNLGVGERTADRYMKIYRLRTSDNRGRYNRNKVSE